MAKIDTRKGLSKLAKMYAKLDNKRKEISNRFRSEHQNYNIRQYNQKHGTNIKPMESEYDQRQKAMMKKYREELKKGNN